MSKKLFAVVSILVIASLTLVACGGAAGGGGAAAGGTVKVVSDLPMTGSSLGQTQTMVNAIKMAFEEVNYKACGGAWTIQYEARDDASAALGKWDPEVATANAKEYAADKNIVAVIGTYNSGAAKLEIPILNPENLVMISPANTYPGLTVAAEGVTAEGEPEVYYPSGKRNYFRVVGHDNIQGPADAVWAQELGAKTAYIFDDQEAYGKGVADAYHVKADAIGLTVLGQEGIDTKAADYKALATKIVGLAPDTVFFGMITQSGAGQLVKDLRGAGYTGIIMGPDGIQEKALIDAAGQAAEGVYASFAGYPADAMTGDAAKWRDAYKAKYNATPEVYASYSTVSVQVLLAAFEKVCAAGGKLTDREAVRAAVAASANVPSILGPVTFDANGDPTAATMTGSKVVNGAWVFQQALSTK